MCAVKMKVRALNSLRFRMIVTTHPLLHITVFDNDYNNAIIAKTGGGNYLTILLVLSGIRTVTPNHKCL